MENQEKDLKRFVIEYEDGTVREVKKGFLCTMEPGEDDDVTFTYDIGWWSWASWRPCGR